MNPSPSPQPNIHQQLKSMRIKLDNGESLENDDPKILERVLGMEDSAKKFYGKGTGVSKDNDEISYEEEGLKEFLKNREVVRGLRIKAFKVGGEVRPKSKQLGDDLVLLSLELKKTTEDKNKIEEIRNRLHQEANDSEALLDKYREEIRGLKKELDGSSLKNESLQKMLDKLESDIKLYEMQIKDAEQEIKNSAIATPDIEVKSFTPNDYKSFEVWYKSNITNYGFDSLRKKQGIIYKKELIESCEQYISDIKDLFEVTQNISEEYRGDLESCISILMGEIDPRKAGTSGYYNNKARLVQDVYNKIINKTPTPTPTPTPQIEMTLETKDQAEARTGIQSSILTEPQLDSKLEPEALVESQLEEKKQSDNVWSSTMKELEHAEVRSAVNSKRDEIAKKEKDLHDIEVLKLEAEKLTLEIEKARLRKELEEALKKAKKPPETKKPEQFLKPLNYDEMMAAILGAKKIKKEEEKTIKDTIKIVEPIKIIPEIVKTPEDNKTFWNRTGKYLALFVAAAGMGGAITNAYNNVELERKDGVISSVQNDKNNVQAQVNKKIEEVSKEITSKANEAVLQATVVGLEKAGVKAEIVNGGIAIGPKQNSEKSAERNTDPKNYLNKNENKAQAPAISEVVANQKVSKIKSGPDAWADYTDDSISNAISAPNLLQKQNNLGNLVGFSTNMPLGFETPELGLRALLSQVNKDQRVTGDLNKNGASGNMSMSEYITKYTKLEVGSTEHKNYLKIVKETTGANENVQIKDIETKKLAAAVTKAEGAAYIYNSTNNTLEVNIQNKNNIAAQIVGSNMMRSGYTDNNFYGNVNYKLV